MIPSWAKRSASCNAITSAESYPPTWPKSEYEQAANAILRRKDALESLEKAASDLFGHEEYIRDEMKRVGRLGRFISEQSLLALITSFLQSHHPTVRVWDDENGIFGLRLTPELRNDIRRAAIGGTAWVDRSQDDRLLVTTRGELAFRHSDIELINASHPLVRAAIAALTERLASPAGGLVRVNLRWLPARTKASSLGRTSSRFTRIPSAVFADEFWSPFSGRKPRGRFSKRRPVRAPLLHLVLERAAEWDRLESMPPMPYEVWMSLEREGRARNRRVLQNERRENEALYARRAKRSRKNSSTTIPSRSND